ncbi:hypothetical protein F0726_02209 [Acidithiobacillus caldus]|nr:hypothetical protein F0726_02209 [Acidithiobacillus caldus]
MRGSGYGYTAKGGYCVARAKERFSSKMTAV